MELKEQTETDRLPRVKEKRNYKRFELIPFLAILGCIGMLLFEGFFIFELYDHAVERTESSASAPFVAEPAVRLPVIETPVVLDQPVVETPVPAETDTPVSTNAAPTEIEPVPANRESAEPAIVPVG